MRKIVLLVITIMLLVSCSAGEISNAASRENAAYEGILSESDAAKIVEELIPKADMLYSIFYRGDLPADDTKAITDENGFRYAPVTENYKTLDELMQDAQAHFTLNYLENNFYKNLSEDHAYFKDIEGQLYKNIDIVSEGENKWYPQYAVISELNENIFTATVPYTDVYDTQRESELTVINDGGGWKIDKWVLNLAANVGQQK